jgi:hypothetical protein
MISEAISLTRAESLKLRRRRGLIALAFAIAVGAVAIMFTVLAVRHASNPVHVPGGGVKNFDNATDFLGALGVVIGALIGATAGSGDAEAGVLRDLVATGRSRLALFGARALAGVGITLAIVLAGLLLATVCAVTLNDTLPAPSLSHIVHRGAAVLAFAAAGALASVGAATFARSRGPVIAAVIVLGVMVSQALLHVSFLGDMRAALPLAAFDRMAGDTIPGINTSLASAIAVTAAWGLAGVGAGAWWARRAEI